MRIHCGSINERVKQSNLFNQMPKNMHVLSDFQ